MRASLPATGQPARSRFGSAHRLAPIVRSMVRLLALCAMFVLIVLSACKKDAPKRATAVDLAPVPAPAGLAADIFIPKPATVFASLRTSIGGPLALAPATFPAAVVTLLGLTPQLLEQIDGNAPCFGVVTDDGARTAVVLGVRVRDGSRTVSLMTSGADAKYTAGDDPSGVTLLEPKPTLTTQAAALGVVGNYLLIATLREDLLKSGPYVGRTLPKHPTEQGDIVLLAPAGALKGPIVKRIRDGWAQYKAEKRKEAEAMREQKGKDADFAEPGAVLADVDARVSRVAEMLVGLSQARLQIDDVQTGIRARMTMIPEATGAASHQFAQLVTGDAKPMLDLPAGAVFGLLLRDSAETRADGAKQQAASLSQLLGGRLADGDALKVKGALETWATGRGDWLTVGLKLTPQAPILHVRGAMANDKAMDAALRQMLGLVEVPGFREPLFHHLGRMVVGKPSSRGDAVVVHVVRDKQTKRKEDQAKSEFDIVWRILQQDMRFELFGAADAKSVLEPGDPRAATVRGRADVAALIDALGDEVSFALYFEPKQFVASIAIQRVEAKNNAAPVFVSYGGKKTEGWVRLDLAHEAARELLRMATQRR
jgi:hypothetical protein